MSDDLRQSIDEAIAGGDTPDAILECLRRYVDRVWDPCIAADEVMREVRKYLETKANEKAN